MNNIKAVVFDLYGTLFDVHSVAARCEVCFPGHGREVSTLWRQKQLEYTWLRSLMDRYVNFEQVTAEALRFTCQHLRLDLDASTSAALCDAYLHITPFAEVPGALRELKPHGLPLAILSNGSPRSIEAVVSNAGLRDEFTHLLSVDAMRIYKPDSRVYGLAEQALDLDRSKILFVSSNAWDATGAKHFGFPTCWINRSGNTFDEMGQKPDWIVGGLDAGVSLFVA
jgi:2-haloacid dehalogenase